MNSLNTKFRNIEVSQKELLDNVLKGYAVCTAELKENADGYCTRANDNFVSSQIIGVDIDNQKFISNDETREKTKARLTAEEGYLSYHDIVNDTFIKQNASFVYCTPSHTDEWHRIRIFFVLKNKHTNKELQKKLNTILSSYYHGDEATKANCQIFYGNKDAQHEFFGNLLDDDTVNELIREYDFKFGKDVRQSYKEINSSVFTKEQLQEILKFIFKNGKISNEKWWKVPTILKNLGTLTDQEIVDMIRLAVGETGDVFEKLKHADKYKNSMSLGTLIYFAKENGYELPTEITSKAKHIKFWQTKSNDKDGKVTASISYSLLNKFLINNGFRQIEHDKGKQIIRIDSLNQIEEISETKLREFVFNYVCNEQDVFDCSKDKFAVEEQLRRNSTTVFSSVISNLPLFNNQLDEIISDTEEETFITYKNGYLVISKDTIEFNDYSKMKGYVWKNSVLKRDFRKPDTRKSEFQVFLERVCTTRKDDTTLEFNSQKYDTMRSAIGYLLNRYKKRAVAKAVVLCDEAISNSPNGGTGKSIFADALGKVRNSTIIDGKSFDESSRFKFETVTEATEIINVDDCSSKFQFEKMFHLITGELTVEKKGISRFTIPFERSPKLCFSTNHTFQGDGNSHERRIFEIEFSNYFNQKHTPVDEFGHQLFYDWDTLEANRFDSFVADCIQYFLQKGLVKYSPVNLENKKLIENTSPELAEYFTQYLKHDTLYRSDCVLEDFIDIHKISITQTAMTRAINYWGNTYLKMNVVNEYDRVLKTKLFAVCSSPKLTMRDFKKGSDYENIKNGRMPVPSETLDYSFEKLTEGL